MVYMENRPRGRFEPYSQGRICTVKPIYANRKKRLSLQYHHKRGEHWNIIKGTGEVTVCNRNYCYRAGDSFKIGKKAKHMIAANTGTLFLEIAYGKFDENDIVRIEDDFGRVNENKR